MSPELEDRILRAVRDEDCCLDEDAAESEAGGFDGLTARLKASYERCLVAGATNRQMSAADPKQETP